LPNEITLTKRQIDKLYKIACNFKDVKKFIVEESRNNGIGPSCVVKLKVFDEKEQTTDTVVDITDYKIW
jgi:hypothetical protein